MRRNMPICYLVPMPHPSTEDFYRQIHTGTPGDLQFYGRLVDGTEEVLELGCGWGRLTTPLAEKSRVIVGLDESARFCEMARESLREFSHAQVLQHDIRIPWKGTDGRKRRTLGKYDRIFAPYNLLYALGGETGVARALEFVAAHLEEDGEFWCDVYAMDGLQLALDQGETTPDDDDQPVATFVWQGRKYPVLESSVLNPSTQSLDVVYRAVEPNSDRSFFESSLKHHYLLLHQIENLLQGVGLEISLLLGGFDGRPYDEEAEHLVFCARWS